MIANITQKVLSYDKNEFMPIYREGKIDNTDEFVRYKMKRALKPVIHKVDDFFVNH